MSLAFDNLEGKFISDKLGRNHHKRLVAGPSLVKLRACKFDPSTGMTHVNDLLHVLSGYAKTGKTVAFLKVDNGSDWNLHLPL